MENEIKNENVMNGENETVEAKETNKFATLGKWIGAGVAAVAAVALGAFALTKFGGNKDSDDLDAYECDDTADEDYEDVAE
jgi:hypothetical protein